MSIFMWIMWNIFFVVKVVVGLTLLVAWPFTDTSKYADVFSAGHPLRVGVDCLLMAYLTYFAFLRKVPLGTMHKDRH